MDKPKLYIVKRIETVIYEDYVEAESEAEAIKKYQQMEYHGETNEDNFVDNVEYEAKELFYRTTK